MPHTTPAPRIEHPRQIHTQISYLLNTDHRRAARTTDRGQSIKHSRDQTDSTTGTALQRSCELDTHMINKTVPAP